MDCSLPSSSVHGISQTRILEGVSIFLCSDSSRPRVWTCISCIIGRFFITELPGKILLIPLGNSQCRITVKFQLSFVAWFSLLATFYEIWIVIISSQGNFLPVFCAQFETIFSLRYLSFTLTLGVKPIRISVLWRRIIYKVPYPVFALPYFLKLTQTPKQNNIFRFSRNPFAKLTLQNSLISSLSYFILAFCLFFFVSLSIIFINKRKYVSSISKLALYIWH